MKHPRSKTKKYINKDMPAAEKLYNAKILLFGEYGIIKDSMGLSIPYDFYKGALVFSENMTPEMQKSNESIGDFCAWLKDLNGKEFFKSHIDTDRLENDIENGLYFDSSIPLGYGVGSSGALVAAVYERYADNPASPAEVSPQDIIALKETLGHMESFFHGHSSGLDPLICYMNLPILIRSRHDIGTVGIPNSKKDGKGAIFLLDSGMSHSTGSLIDIFFEKMKNEGFRKMLKDEFGALNDACIEAFINGRKASLLENVKMLSLVVLKHFYPMIPRGVRRAWVNGLRTGEYYLKLCGAGGGGFILGFTDDYEKAARTLREYSTQPIYRF